MSLLKLTLQEKWCQLSLSSEGETLREDGPGWESGWEPYYYMHNITLDDHAVKKKKPHKIKGQVKYLEVPFMSSKTWFQMFWKQTLCYIFLFFFFPTSNTLYLHSPLV